MTTKLTIGDFSRMTHLSVKALRHYHETGVLEPAGVDPDSGYRLYAPNQVTTAQVIRRFRDLGMPLEQVKAVLEAPDFTTRNEIIVAHLARMESELEETRSTVASLRTLLERPPEETAVEYRSVAPIQAVGIAEPVTFDDSSMQWWEDAFAELYAALESAGIEPAGPAGALYSGEFFEEGRGEVVAFVPVADGARGPRRLEIPGAEYAVTIFEGPFAELDQAYGTLGEFVSEREIGVDGPIRENYLVSSLDTDDESKHRTEVCWPVFHTRGTPYS